MRRLHARTPCVGHFFIPCNTSTTATQLECAHSACITTGLHRERVLHQVRLRTCAAPWSTGPAAASGRPPRGSQLCGRWRGGSPMGGAEFRPAEGGGTACRPQPAGRGAEAGPGGRSAREFAAAGGKGPADAQPGCASGGKQRLRRGRGRWYCAACTGHLQLHVRTRDIFFLCQVDCNAFTS